MTSEANAAPPAEASGRAYLLLIATALCWGGNAVFGRLAVGEVSPMALVALRWLGVLLLLSVIAHGQVRRDWPVLRRHLPFILSLGALGFAAFNGVFYVAAHFTTAVNIGILQGSIPIFVLLGAFAIDRVRVSGLQMAGAAVTLLGVVIVASQGDLGRLAALAINSGDILMIGACLLHAGYTVALKRRPQVSALGLFTVMAGAAFAVSLLMAGTEAALGLFQWPTAKGWMVVGLVVVFPSFLAQIFYIQGIALIGPGRAGIFVNLVPVFAAILAVSILTEPFRPFHALALALVLGGIWLAERRRRRVTADL